MISKQTSVRDAPGHTTLKFRDDADEKKDLDSFKRELDEREAKHFDEKRREAEKKAGIRAITGETADERGELALPASKKSKLLSIATAAEDEDLPEEDDADSDSDSSDSDDDDDDDDDTAQLLAELEKIKKERAEEQAKKEAMKAEDESRVRLSTILRGNPLLNDGSTGGSGDFTVKRRWDEDTVFKNCARGEETKKKPQYINDTLRSEAHLKFMQRFIK